MKIIEKHIGYRSYGTPSRSPLTTTGGRGEGPTVSEATSRVLELGWTANRKPPLWKKHFPPEEADFFYLTEILYNTKYVPNTL